MENTLLGTTTCEQRLGCEMQHDIWWGERSVNTRVWNNLLKAMSKMCWNVNQTLWKHVARLEKHAFGQHAGKGYFGGGRDWTSSNSVGISMETHFAARPCEQQSVLNVKFQSLAGSGLLTRVFKMAFVETRSRMCWFVIISAISHGNHLARLNSHVLDQHVRSGHFGGAHNWTSSDSENIVVQTHVATHPQNLDTLGSVKCSSGSVVANRLNTCGIGENIFTVQS